MGQTKIKSKVIVLKNESDFSAIRELEKHIEDGYSIIDVTALHSTYNGAASAVHGSPIVYTLKHTEVSY